MNFQDFLKKFFTPAQANFSFNQEKSILDLEVPERISKFFEKTQTNLTFTEADFKIITDELKTIKNNALHDALLYFIYQRLQLIFLTYKNEISTLSTQIQNAVQKGEAIPQSKFNDFDNYKSLLNIFLFVNETQQSSHYSGNYPGLKYEDRLVLTFDVPFAINALSLTGVFPKDQIYGGMKLGLPLYPPSLAKEEKDKTPLSRGIKQSEHYYPFTRTNKLVGVNLKDTFLATNGKKLLFVRGSQYAPWAVMASKIATFVNAKHFSSERQLDISLAASKKIPGYAVPISDTTALTNDGRAVKEVRKNFIEVQKRMIPGTGVIDEVLNFVSENDPNAENYGFSSSDIESCYLTKIDFDCCELSSHLPLKQDPEEWWRLYDQNKLTGLLYKLAPDIKYNKDYINEKLITRLKLALMTEELFAELANKSYPAGKEKEIVIKECVNRSEIALNLFFTHPNAKEFLLEHPDIMNKLFCEATTYIDRHFTKNEASAIKVSLNERSKVIQTKISEAFPSAPKLSLFTENSDKDADDSIDKPKSSLK